MRILTAGCDLCRCLQAVVNNNTFFVCFICSLPGLFGVKCIYKLCHFIQSHRMITAGLFTFISFIYSSHVSVPADYSVALLSPCSV